MALTVDQAFDDFYAAINLPGDFRSLAKARRDWIVARLKGRLDVLEAFPTGSIPRFTALGQGRSDLDVMVALNYSRHFEGRKPSAVLRTMRDALSPLATSVRRNGQAVTVRFKSWPAVDVVPAKVLADSQGRTVAYSIPDMPRERWIITQPKKHSEAIRTWVGIYGDSVRRVIKMAKHWNQRNGSLLQSFHVETLLLRKVTSCGGDGLSWPLSKWFEEARVTLARGTSIMVGDQRVDDYLTSADRRTLVSKLMETCDAATHAWFLTYNGRGKHREAIGLWRRIFGRDFPAYG